MTTKAYSFIKRIVKWYIFAGMSDQLISKIPLRGSLSLFVEEAAFLRLHLPAAIPRTLVPDGRPTLLINLNESVFSFGDDNYHLEPLNTKLLPVHTRPIQLTMGPECKFLYIRFFPYGLHHLFGIRGARIGEGLRDPSDIAGDCIRAVINRLPRRCNDEELTDAIMGGLESLSVRAMQPSVRLVEACNLIKNSKGRTTLERLCRGSLAEYKALQRCFRDYVELSPKLYARMVRFEAIMEQLRKHPSTDWFDLLTLFELHDQSHLIREFRYFTGHTPGEFSKGGVDGFI